MNRLNTCYQDKDFCRRCGDALACTGSDISAITKDKILAIWVAEILLNHVCRNLREKGEDKAGRNEYSRLASEDPSLANDPSLH